MARGVNRVILVGALWQDPEMHYLPNGGAVANISVATSDTWKDKQTGEPKERTEWHRVVIFGKLAEIAGKYLKKGSQIYIEGSLQTRKWQDQTGQDRYITEIVVNIGGVLQILGSRNNNDMSASAPNQNRGQSENNITATPAPRQQPAAQATPIMQEPPMDFDDDIPF